MVWADDFTFVAAGVLQLAVMLREFKTFMEAQGIGLKASKCAWMASTPALEVLEQEDFRMEIGGILFTHEDSLVVLGSRLSATGDTTTSLDFCKKRAWRHWFQRRAQLCRRRVPLSRRINRYYSTVGLTLLHGFEGIPLTQCSLRSVQSFDRHCLREMLCMRRPVGRGWVEHRRKQNAVLRRVLLRMGRVELAVQVLKKQFGWAGHAARMPAEPAHIAAQWASGTLLESWKLQQAVGQTVDKQNKLKWRHDKKGPVTRWDSLIHRVLGPTWPTIAQDRNKWKAAWQSFAYEAGVLLLGAGHRLFGLIEGGEGGLCEGNGMALLAG